ncbi:MAG: hypothetical protein WC707_04145 [Candidatus Babeliaceae bacterium]|jgi:hypothetical protein
MHLNNKYILFFFGCTINAANNFKTITLENKTDDQINFIYVSKINNNIQECIAEIDKKSSISLDIATTKQPYYHKMLSLLKTEKNADVTPQSMWLGKCFISILRPCITTSLMIPDKDFNKIIIEKNNKNTIIKVFRTEDYYQQYVLEK